MGGMKTAVGVGTVLWGCPYCAQPIVVPVQVEIRAGTGRDPVLTLKSGDVLAITAHLQRWCATKGDGDG